ncbi:MAG: caspase family protein, partial [Desulfobacteraceae bacterium]|nr:caspase family protein [Desulfobacteraceae bacterium]
MVDDKSSSGTQTANVYAVIIGIGQYKDPTIPTLKYTNVDAENLHDLLIDPRKLGIHEENIKLLLNEDATLQNIKSTVGTWLLRKADEDSTVIIFFSGHGGVEPDPSGLQAKYLLPWDALRNDLYATSISSRDFEGLLLRIKSNRLVMFLDACHSGGVISREGIKDVDTIETLCADLTTGSGRAIIAASKGNQQSFEDDKLSHGIFAYHLLEALKNKADTDRDGKVTLIEVFNYLVREVPKTAWELAGAVQEPMMRSELEKDIVLVIDKDRLEEIRKEEERAGQEAKKRKDKGKLFWYFSEGKLSTEQYDKALKVYE